MLYDMWILWRWWWQLCKDSARMLDGMVILWRRPPAPTIHARWMAPSLHSAGPRPSRATGSRPITPPFVKKTFACDNTLRAKNNCARQRQRAERKVAREKKVVREKKIARKKLCAKKIRNLFSGFYVINTDVFYFYFLRFYIFIFYFLWLYGWCCFFSGFRV